MNQSIHKFVVHFAAEYGQVEYDANKKTFRVLIDDQAKKQSVDAMQMTGESYDCGKKLGYMQAFVQYGLRNLKEGAKFRKSIEKLLTE